MEVHAHTYPSTSSGHQKKWTHYLWEFLMLFFAVFCGFLAEYQLEHKIEKEKGKQYIRSFYHDLKTDTAEFARLIRNYENKSSALSKRNECFDSLSGLTSAVNLCLAKLINNCIGFPDFVNADQTLLQLKNAGGLRLLNQADADSILDYDKQTRLFIRYETTGYQEREYRIREFLYANLNYKSRRLKNNDPTIPILNSNELEKINQFFNMLEEYAEASDYHLRSLKKLTGKAVSLIHYFKNKYHFD